jgi:hypothetical protein
VRSVSESQILDNLNVIPPNSTNSLPRLIGDDNGRGIIIQNQIIGGLGDTYLINDVGGILFSFFSTQSCYSDSTIFNQNLNYFQYIFSLLIFVIILMKISHQKFLLNIIIIYFNLYFINFIIVNIFNRSYGLGLTDAIKVRVLLNEATNDLSYITLEIFKSIFFPADSYSMWGFHPRNYALSLFFFALSGFIFKQTNYSYYLIIFSFLFHLWSGLLFFFLYIIILILAKEFLVHYKLLAINFILLSILFILPIIKPLAPISVFLNLLIFVVLFLLFMSRSHTSTYLENTKILNSNYRSIIILSFLFFFYITSLIFSFKIASNINLLGNLESFYIIRGFIAEGPQRLSPIFFPLILICTLLFSHDFKKIKIL